jgi:hypothetical protein
MPKGSSEHGNEFQVLMYQTLWIRVPLEKLAVTQLFNKLRNPEVHYSPEPSDDSFHPQQYMYRKVDLLIPPSSGQ